MVLTPGLVFATFWGPNGKVSFPAGQAAVPARLAWVSWTSFGRRRPPIRSAAADFTTLVLSHSSVLLFSYDGWGHSLHLRWQWPRWFINCIIQLVFTLTQPPFCAQADTAWLKNVSCTVASTLQVLKPEKNVGFTVHSDQTD